MKPQLLPKDNPDLSALTYPIFVSPKYDGIRCVTTDEGPKSRTLKNIPNKHIFNTLSKLQQGFDGELIVGSPTDPDVYRKTNSAVMSYEGAPEFSYYVYDFWNNLGVSYVTRDYLLRNASGYPSYIRVVPSILCNSKEAAEEEIIKNLNLGYEGSILRNPQGLYKYGRCTLKENNIFKYKPYADDEAVIVGVECEYENTNEATINEVGLSKRTIHKANMIPKESLGSIKVSNDTWGYFNIGSGFAREEKTLLWALHKDRNELVGKVVKFKYFPIGIKDKPRHPIFLGFRDLNIDG